MKFLKYLTILFLVCSSYNSFSKEKDVSEGTPTLNNTQTLKNIEDIKLKPAPLPICDMGSDWIGVSFADGVSTYRFKENPKVIGTFHLQTQDQPFSVRELKSNNFFKQWMKNKRQWLMLVGIYEYTVDQHHLKKRKNRWEFNVTGSYKRLFDDETKVLEGNKKVLDGKKVFFKEQFCYFESNKMYQALVISPVKKILDTNPIQAFFKKAQNIKDQKKAIKKRSVK